jgi:hypothetical protein
MFLVLIEPLSEDSSSLSNELLGFSSTIFVVEIGDGGYVSIFWDAV